MPLLKRRTTREAEIPTSSMADIAFLLLIFFLVTTTIDVYTGIYMELPPPLEDTAPPEISDRNLLTVLVNRDGDVLVEGEFMTLGDIRQEVIRHVTNNGADPNYADTPSKAIVSFKTERQASYEMYVDVLDELRSAYVDIRDGYARSNFGAPDYATYKERLPADQEDQVADAFPIKISLAEPDAGTGG